MVRLAADRMWSRAAWELSHAVFAHNVFHRRWTDWVAVMQGALAVAEEVADVDGQRALLSSLGVACVSLGDVARAEEFSIKALRACEAHGDPVKIAQSHINLAGIVNRRHDTRRAEWHLREALDQPGVAEHPILAPSLRVTLGHTYYLQRRYREAATALRHGLANGGRPVQPHTTALLHHGCGEVALQQRSLPDAASHARAAVVTAETYGLDLRLAYALNLLGAALAPTAPTKAREAWSRSVDVARELAHPLAEESAFWLTRDLPDTEAEYLAVELPRRHEINRLP